MKLSHAHFFTENIAYFFCFREFFPFWGETMNTIKHVKNSARFKFSDDRSHDCFHLYVLWIWTLWNQVMLTFSENCVDIYATKNTGTIFWPQILCLGLFLDAENKNWYSVNVLVLFGAFKCWKFCNFWVFVNFLEFLANKSQHT